MAKLGDRIEFGSAIEPCGGVFVSIKDGVAIIRWDCGGQTVATLRVLAALACGGEAEPAALFSVLHGPPTEPHGIQKQLQQVMLNVDAT